MPQLNINLKSFLLGFLLGGLTVYNFSYTQNFTPQRTSDRHRTPLTGSSTNVIADDDDADDVTNDTYLRPKNDDEIKKKQDDEPLRIDDDKENKRIDNADSSESDEEEEEKEKEKEVPNIIYPDSHPCSLFGSSNTKSAISIWRQNLSRVVESSRHHNEFKNQYTWHDFTAELLNYMTPERLQKSVKQLPVEYWDRVGDVLNIVHKRWKWLENGGGSDDKEAPRKLNVVVLGGSVTLGVQCKENPVEDTSRFSRKACSWTNRLKEFIIGITEKDMVEFHQITLGGTNTATGNTIWKYSIFPDEMPFPDIVINAFSTNDMHVMSLDQAKSANLTLEDLVFKMNEEFVRNVLTKPPPSRTSGTSLCQPKTPLLLYYDDYMGNEQRELKQIFSFSNAINSLASYYGFGLVSYADAVKRLVYPETTETWFSPHNWPERQIHPGMGMHISSTWVWTFNFLTMATTYCEMPRAMNITFSPHHDDYKAIEGLPELKNPETKIKSGPAPRPKVIPPKLDDDLSLENIGERWKESESTTLSKEEKLEECDISTNLLMPRQCIFSWMADLSASKLPELDEIMKKVIGANKGWESANDNRKMGYAAAETGAIMSMHFKDISQPVVALNFMVMTSYGEKWKDSKVNVKVYDKTNSDDAGTENMIGSMSIDGYHEKETSETFVHVLKLDETLKRGNSMQVDIQLVSGTTFKMTGMAFCSH